MTTQEVADELSMSYAMALAMMKIPSFPSVKMGRRLFVPKELLYKWIERHSGESFGYRPFKEVQQRSLKRHQNTRIQDFKRLNWDELQHGGITQC